MSLEVGPGAEQSLAEANVVVASMRAGRLRLSFHLVNDGSDADTVVEALAGQLIR